MVLPMFAVERRKSHRLFYEQAPNQALQAEVGAIQDFE